MADGLVALGLRISDAAAEGLVELGLRTSEAAALGFTPSACATTRSFALKKRRTRADRSHRKLFMYYLVPHEREATLSPALSHGPLRAELRSFVFPVFGKTPIGPAAGKRLLSPQPFATVSPDGYPPLLGECRHSNKVAHNGAIGWGDADIPRRDRQAVALRPPRLRHPMGEGLDSLQLDGVPLRHRHGLRQPQGARRRRRDRGRCLRRDEHRGSRRQDRRPDPRARAFGGSSAWSACSRTSSPARWRSPAACAPRAWRWRSAASTSPAASPC